MRERAAGEPLDDQPGESDLPEMSGDENHAAGASLMCACEPGFTCTRCQPRQAADLGEWDWREVEQWLRDQELSRHDFAEPFKP